MSRVSSKKRPRARLRSARPVRDPKWTLTLRESEARRAAILDTALDSVIAMDHQGRIVDFNPAAERTFGYRRDEVIGKTLAETIVPPSLRESHRRGLAKYLETGEGPVLGRRIELTGLRKDGSEFPVELAITRIAGEPPTFVGFARDISDQKELESARRESEERFQKSFYGTPVAMSLLALPDNRFIDVNESFLRLFEFTREEVIGRTSLDIGLWSDPAAREGLLEKLRAGEPVRNVELTLRTKSGKTRHVIVAVETLSLGPHEAWLSAVVDITETKDLERRLLENERLAAMGRLTGYVAHEINTPLTNISLLAATAAKRAKDPEIISRLEKINAQRRLIASILQDLAGLTRPPPIQPVETDLRTIVDASLEQMDPYLRDGVELRKEFAGHPVVADVDARRIQQVLVNLTKNALQATSTGVVTVRLEDRGETVAFVVHDTGPGMPPEVIEKLFQPFFTTKPKEQGTGLGLAFAKNVVSAHGGAIEVASEIGKGSTFTVVLPKVPSPP